MSFHNRQLAVPWFEGVSVACGEEGKNETIRIWVWNSWAYFEVPIGVCESTQFKHHSFLLTHRLASVVQTTHWEMETVCVQEQDGGGLRGGNNVQA